MGEDEEFLTYGDRDGYSTPDYSLMRENPYAPKAQGIQLPTVQQHGAGYAIKNTKFGDGKMKLMGNVAKNWVGSEQGKATLGKIGAGITGAMAIGASTFENWKPVNVDKYKNEFNSISQQSINSGNNASYQYGTGSTDNIKTQAATMQVNNIDGQGKAVDFHDLRPSKGKQWANVGKSTLSGAAAGMQIAGPWGALVGGAIGGISAGLGSLFGRRKAKKEARDLNNRRISANAQAEQSNAINNNLNTANLNNAIDTQAREHNMEQQANFHALGGFTSGVNDYSLANTMFATQAQNSLNKTKFTAIPTERAEREIQPNTFAGGGFSTTPSYYPAKSSFGSPSQVSEINNGGTHEQNKYEGVPLGVDDKGIPNLVEEGEVIWRGAGNRLIGKHLFADGGSVEQEQDYVFSNRLKPSQTLLNEVNIAVKQPNKKKKDQKSYADIAKDIYKEQKERPNDPITNNTINANLGKLKDAQEVDRAKEEAKQARKAMANGMAGMMGNGMNPAPEVNQMQDPNMQMQQEQSPEQMQQPQDLSMYNRSGNEMMGQQMAFGGEVNKFDGGGKFNPFNWFRKKNNQTQTNDYYIDPNQNPYANRGFGNIVNGDTPMVDNSMMGVDGSILNNGTFIKPVTDSPSAINYSEQPQNQFGAVHNAGSYGKTFLEAAPNAFGNNITGNLYFNPYTGEFSNTSFRNSSTSMAIANNGQQVANNGDVAVANNANTGVNPQVVSNSNSNSSYTKTYSSEQEPVQVAGGMDYNTNAETDNKTNLNYKNVNGVPLPENKGGNQETRKVSPTTGIDFRPTPTWFRYVPVFGGMLSVARDMAGKDDPDESLVNEALANAKRGNYMPVSPSHIGDYLQYNPFDINYATNKLNAQSAATRRAMLNASNGNRATAAANMLAADYNAQVGLGEMQKQAYDYNLGQRKTVGEFNKDTNKFNATQDLEAQRANQQALASLKNYQMQSNLDAARLKYQMDMDNLSRKHANLTSFLNNVGEVGRDNLNYNMAMSNPSLYYGMDRNGNVGYKYNESLKRFENQDNEKERKAAYKEYKKQQESNDKKAVGYNKWKKNQTKKSNGGSIKRTKSSNFFDNYALDL